MKVCSRCLLCLFGSIILDACVNKESICNSFSDELNDFEEAWKGNVKLHMHGWRDESDKQNNACK